MLHLTHLIGFGAGSSGADKTPDAIAFADIFDAGVTAAASTDTVAITGIDVAITLRLSLTAPMSSERIVTVYRDGTPVETASSGTTVDVVMTNGQTLQYLFVNAQDNSTWNGTATVTNLTDASATLDTFAFLLQDTGSGGGGPVSVASESPP